MARKNRKKKCNRENRKERKIKEKIKKTKISIKKNLLRKTWKM